MEQTYIHVPDRTPCITPAPPQQATQLQGNMLTISY